ncbi:MAG: GNAT family N-acetyltransferase, partial [Rhizomicrobium sp.]
PAARRTGAATALLTAALATLRSGPTRRLFLEVAEDNTGARALYQRFGFVDGGRRKAYYAASPAGALRADAVIMTLAL